MHRMKLAIASTAVGLWALSAGAVTVTPADAMSQVGRTAKVCGVVASTVYEANSRATRHCNADQPRPAECEPGTYRGDLRDRPR
jgi:hypothetical protein